jgi:hypothetical protein
MVTNGFSEFEGDNWTKIACGNISNQALSAWLAGSQFERCAAQQALHFRAAVLLGGNNFEIYWFCRWRGCDWYSGCLVWAGQKNQHRHFSPGKYNSCTLNSVMNAKWRCFLGEMGAEMREMAVTSGLWSVQSWKDQPSQKWRKCLIATWAANNSLSKVE